MRESSKAIGALIVAWVFVTGGTAPAILAIQGAFFYASNDPIAASLVWSFLAIVFVSGIMLLVAVHFYVLLVLDESAMNAAT